MNMVLEVEARLNGHFRGIASISIEGPELEEFAGYLTMSRRTRNDLKYSTTSVAPELVQKLPYHCSNGLDISLDGTVFMLPSTISGRTSKVACMDLETFTPHITPSISNILNRLLPSESLGYRIGSMASQAVGKPVEPTGCFIAR